MANEHDLDDADGPAVQLLPVLRERMREVFSARPWLAVSEVDQGAVGTATSLLAAGATDVLAIGVTPGVGELDPDIALISIGQELSGTIMDAVRSTDRIVHDPPPAILRDVDAFDTDGHARAVIDFTLTGGHICGRASYGARTPDWATLEDKLLATELWAAAGVATAPTRVVDLADAAAVAEAHEEVASELGGVWAVDNALGWHGGGEGTHWVTDRASIEETRRTLAEHHDRVRIMPFVEGLPCSIHGMVLGETIISFRPMEMFIYRDHGAGRIVYGKAGSTWTPARDDAQRMKTAARLVGDQLRARAGFRGVFTLDGILGVEGFVPTEVNSRFGGALPREVAAPDGEPLSLFLLNVAAIEGVFDDIDPAALEALVVSCIDASPSAVGLLHTQHAPPEERSLVVGLGPTGDFVELPDSEGGHDEAVATVRWGTRDPGGLVFFRSGPAFPVGPPSGPMILELARFVDDQWDLGLPGLEAARPFG